MLWPKKNSYQEFDDEKKFLRLENPPPPHNFSNGPSLSYFFLLLYYAISWLTPQYANCTSPIINMMHLICACSPKFA